MNRASRPREGTASAGLRLGWVVVLVVYLGLLLAVIGPAVAPGSHGDAPHLAPWEVERVSDLRGRLADSARFLLVELARFAPLGLLVVMALPGRESRFGRFAFVFVPGLVLSSGLATTVVAFELGWPGLRDLFLPVGACFLGAWLGMSARRGVGALLLVVPKLAAAAVLLGGIGIGLGYLATESQPLDLPRPSMSSEEKRELVRRFRAANPSRLTVGDRHELRLSAGELDGLLGWGFTTLGVTPRTRLETGGGRALVRTSLRVPVVGRYLNLSAEMTGGVREGELEWDIRELNVGHLRAPSLVLGPLSSFGEAVMQHDRALRPLWAGIDSLELSDGGMRVSYGPMDLRGDVLDAFLQRLGPDEAVLEAARAQLEHLAGAAERIAASEDRFGAAMESAFGQARQRTLLGADPIVENSGAILALATVLGHPRLRLFAGLDAERETILEARRGIRRVTLRGRSDWTKHFFVSAGLTQLSTVTVSDAAGVLKEELDADTANGGSGFSFGDLLADRAGTLFSRTATRDPGRAVAMQERLASGFVLDDFFPSADGLAEGIPDAELESRYGGVGGAEYRRVTATIEDRLATCAAYR